MPIYWWKIGWGFLVVSKENTNRKVIEETMENIKIYYPNSYIEYCNYEDREEIEGIKLIQDIENNIFHESLIWENYKLKTKNKTIIVKNIWEALEKDFDIIIDSIKEKVYIKWEKLTSKEIHSQSILVEVISKLFNNSWKWISNKELSKSSYSWIKSVMWWRVVYPLKKLVLEKFWKDLDFEIKWIGWDFEMKLDFWNLDVAILEKI